MQVIKVYLQIIIYSWVFLLNVSLQVLVIPKLIFKPIKKYSPAESFESNLYSTHEMKLLSWINYHYTLNRAVLSNSQGLFS